MLSSGRILAIDYGERRIGLALSDELGMIASGAGTIPGDEKAVSQIAELATERGVVHIIVGMPLTLKGEVGDTARMVQRFVEKLSAAIDIPVDTLDERFTSSMAEQAIRDMGVGRKKRRDKGKIDEIAAVILLQGYLDGKTTTAG